MYKADPAGVRRRAGLAMEAHMSTQIRGQPLSRPIAHFFVVLLVSVFMVVAACGGDSKKNKVPVPVLTSVSPRR